MRLRFSVPPGPVIGVVMMSGLAITLIGVIIARSPYTHANLRPQGYSRTDVAYVGEEYVFEGVPLAKPADAQTGDPVHDGGLLFFRYGCASCHGLQGQGSAVGKDLGDASARKIAQKVRSGPKTMPGFSSSELSDEDMDKLIAFLQSGPKQ